MVQQRIREGFFDTLAWTMSILNPPQNCCVESQTIKKNSQTPLCLLLFLHSCFCQLHRCRHMGLWGVDNCFPFWELPTLSLNQNEKFVPDETDFRSVLAKSTPCGELTVSKQGGGWHKANLLCLGHQFDTSLLGDDIPGGMVWHRSGIGNSRRGRQSSGPACSSKRQPPRALLGSPLPCIRP